MVWLALSDFLLLRAEVAKLADALRSGRSARKGLGVQIPPSAPIYLSLPRTPFAACGRIMTMLAPLAVLSLLASFKCNVKLPVYTPAWHV
jgi:hypothetical protein